MTKHHNPIGDDGCEWNPGRDELATVTNCRHSDEHPAAVMLGSDKNMMRLCESCSRLPRFARLRTRRPIVRRSDA